MLLSLAGGAKDLQRDIRADRQGSYCLLLQLLFGTLLAMIYTDDLFTAYVFVEIAAVTAASLWWPRRVDARWCPPSGT